MSFSSKNLGFITLENQSFNVSIVNFNSTENNSARGLDFSRANTMLHLLIEKKLSC